MARRGQRSQASEPAATGLLQTGTRRPESGSLNTYPAWKYLLVLVIALLGAIYAAPNLYPPDYALQLTTRGSDEPVPERVVRIATAALDDGGIPYFGVERSEETALIRFARNEEQIRAREVVHRALLQADLGERYVIALNLASTVPDWLQSLGAARMNYGLDLSGGVHFLLEVDTERAMDEWLDDLEAEIKDRLRETRIRYLRDVKRGEHALTFRFRNEADRDEARSLLSDRIAEFEMRSTSVAGDPALELTLRQSVVDQRYDYWVQQNLQSLRNRVNELGVSEPLVQRLGRNRVVLDLPGIQDSARAREIIGKVANVEFHLVAAPDAPSGQTRSFEYQGRTVEIDRSVIVTGDRVNNAQAGFDPETNMPQVNINLDATGGELMHRATRNNIGRQMAIVFKETKTRTRYVEEDGEEVAKQIPYEEEELISVATIQAALGNRFRITGLSQRESQDLALLLRAGALAAPMYIVEERTVGASLGEENIDRGFMSVAAGFALVLVFMAVYYKVFGICADIALAVNLTLLIAVMSLLGATLTLPGIAGIVLTVGMAVDANVLIFSRIREELSQRRPQQAIQAGFERAFVTILDANVTTFIVAIILYAIGTGPVRGFAVTLAIGIVTSMFTALMGTRALVNAIYGRRNVRRLVI